MLNQFLDIFESQNEPALLVCEESDAAELIKRLEDNGFLAADGANDIIAQVKHSLKTVVLLSEKFDKELYDLLGDLSGVEGLIQKIDAATLKVELIPFDKNNLKLIIVATSDALTKWQKKFPITDRVGIIERLC
jgi:hypothetical protein